MSDEDDGPRDYYILCQEHGVPGDNCALWWKPEGMGYTTDLDKAGLFRERAARRSIDIPIHRDVARRHAVTHVRLDNLRGDPEVTTWK